MVDAVKLRLVPRAADRAVEPAEPPLGDAQLCRAIRDGDAAAASAVCVRLSPRVRGTVRRLLGPADADGDDLVQKSLLEIVRHVDGFRGESSLETWAAAVTARVVYKHIRRRRVERRIFSEQAPDATAGGPVVALDFARRFEARDELARLFVALRALDEDKVFPYLLHDVCGFDLKEIAEIVGTSVSAAQTRLVRGRRLVHEMLSRQASSEAR